MLQKIDLSFPPWELSPNDRGDRRSKTRIRKQLYADWYYTGKANRIKLPEKKIPISLLFYPPNANKRDKDNCLGACKYGLDGLAKAWNIDDSIFGPVLVEIMPPHPPRGKVELYVDNIDMVYKMIIERSANHGREETKKL